MTGYPRRPGHCDGMAWPVADHSRGDFAGYWYVGRAGHHLGEQARAATGEDAVAWGRARTTSVRIRTLDGCSSGPARRHDPKDHATPAARPRRSTEAAALSPERRAPC
jgi:hypothetical protein